jgi:hypothetical protein
MLLPVSTSTSLFHDFILPNASEIRFVRGRLMFDGINTKGEFVTHGTGRPMHDSMIVIFKTTKNDRVQKENISRHPILMGSGASVSDSQ